MTSAASSWASLAIELRLEDVPSEVLDSSRRALANVVGVSLGGAPLDATQRARETVRALGGAQQARMIGMGDASSVDRVALVDGIAAHVLDYDDTQLETVYHPSAPVMAAVAPLAEWRELDGASLLRAWVVGLEVGMRLAVALTRQHYDRGWHVTGTAGGVAAAAAAGALLGLDQRQFVHAVGIAATQASSHRIHFGTMTKSLHVGQAAAGGVLAALLAEQGFDADPAGIDGPRGMLEVMADAPDAAILSADLGSRWLLLENRLKPYACGVVTHPVIDATRELAETGVTSEEIEEIVINVEPLVVELTGKENPTTELEAKFSARHCAAVGFLHGKAGPDEFSPEVVTAAETVALRRRVKIEPTADMDHMTATLTARLNSGDAVELRIEHARGTPERQLTDEELRTKFVDVSSPVLAEAPAGELFERLLRVDDEASWTELLSATLPDPNPVK